MSDFFKDFKKTTRSEWENKILADLKGKSPDLLNLDDSIEEITLKGYQHAEDVPADNQSPGNFPYTRGWNENRNDWQIGYFTTTDNEKEKNKLIIRALNGGANLLVIKAVHSTQWNILLEGVEMNHIDVEVIIDSVDTYKNLSNSIDLSSDRISLNIDFLELSLSEENFSFIASAFKTKQNRFCSVSGFKVQQAGATTWQEIGFCLNTGHEYLLKLMKQGFTIDEAAACISFKIGIGSNYFFETAKIRALRNLWSKIIHAYTPEHSCSHFCHITAVTGFSNKSIKDPYMNLLRQTTEAMSAVNGGVESLVIMPYDSQSVKGPSELAERMALNISNLLKEESYLDVVIDPLGGSYSIEKLTIEIGKKAWIEFQQIEREGGLFSANAIQELAKRINKKRVLRIEKFNNKEIKGIGINIYPPKETVENEWNLKWNYLNMDQLVFENEFKTTVA